MPRKSIGETAMTDAERQARYRAARAAGKPVIRVRRALDHRGRARRWNDNVAGLVEGQVEYAAWLDSLPENLRDSALAEALQAICDLDSPNFRRSSRRAASAVIDIRSYRTGSVPHEKMRRVALRPLHDRKGKMRRDNRQWQPPTVTACRSLAPAQASASGCS